MIEITNISGTKVNLEFKMKPKMMNLEVKLTVY